MRLKEFIIFIVIFTIIYFASFAIYDRFKNKKDIEKKEKNDFNAISLEKYYKFANFYGINSTLNIETLIAIFNELKTGGLFQISVLSSKYNITTDELIVIVEYLEYISVIRKKSIQEELDRIGDLDGSEDVIVLKFLMLFSKKMDYETVIKSAGFGSEKELELIKKHHLAPGVRIEDSTIYYVGDLNE